MPPRWCHVVMFPDTPLPTSSVSEEHVHQGALLPHVQPQPRDQGRAGDQDHEPPVQGRGHRARRARHARPAGEACSLQDTRLQVPQAPPSTAQVIHNSMMVWSIRRARGQPCLIILALMLQASGPLDPAQLWREGPQGDWCA